MRHDIDIEGFAYRLRPISEEDAEFVVSLRSDAKLGRYLHPGAQDVGSQLKWLAQYFERPGDYYFVIERLGRNTPDGVISIYDVDGTLRTGEWGRWILRAGSPAAVESAFLIYSVAFDILQLESVFCRTVAENQKVVSFHDSCGLKMRRMLPGHFVIGDRRLGAVEHRLDRQDWPDVSAKLRGIARAAARRMARA